MGIQGLLPLLKSITTPASVSDYSGMRVAVDTYSWLHKAAFCCSKDICDGRATASFINYCMHRVNLLRHHGVKPLLVFDGGPLPMKAEQEEKRSRSREEHLNRARECEASGNHAAAYDHYQKAVDITPEVAYQLILVLLREEVEFIVSPYEADAQMAYLALRGVVDAVITEDSDLIAYGCPKILFKMDKNGQGSEIQYADLVKNRELNLTSFTKRMVLEMCILSGCDYLPSLPGMGVKRAHNLMRRFRSYDKVIRHLKFSGVAIPRSYEEGFRRSLLTFSHHLVYDPTQDDLVHLNDLSPECGGDLDFLGPRLPQALVRQIARGLVHPVTHSPFQVPEPPTLPVPPRPLCEDRKRIHRHNEQKRLSLPAQKNVLTNYFISKSDASIQQFKAPRVSESLDDSEIAAKLSPCTPSSSPDRSHTVRSAEDSPRTEQDDTANKRLRAEYGDENSDGGAHFLKGYSSHQQKVVARLTSANDENAIGQRKKRTMAKAICSKPGHGRNATVAETSLPKFSSSLFGADMEQAATLSANVTHTKHYSAIAQESIENFTRTISAFAPGARVSGLRRPLKKSNLTNIGRW